MIPLILLPMYFFPRSTSFFIVAACLLAVSTLAILSRLKPAPVKSSEQGRILTRSTAVSSSIVAKNLLRLKSKSRGGKKKPCVGSTARSDSFEYDPLADQKFTKETGKVEKHTYLSMSPPRVVPLVDDTSGVCLIDSQQHELLPTTHFNHQMLRPDADPRTRTPNNPPITISDSLERLSSVPPPLESSISVDKEVEAFCQFLQSSQTRKPQMKMKLKISKSDLEAMKNLSRETKRTSPRLMARPRPRPLYSRCPMTVSI